MTTHVSRSNQAFTLTGPVLTAPPAAPRMGGADDVVFCVYSDGER